MSKENTLKILSQVEDSLEDIVLPTPNDKERLEEVRGAIEWVEKQDCTDEITRSMCNAVSCDTINYETCIHWQSNANGCLHCTNNFEPLFRNITD